MRVATSVRWAETWAGSRSSGSWMVYLMTWNGAEMLTMRKLSMASIRRCWGSTPGATLNVVLRGRELTLRYVVGGLLGGFAGGGLFGELDGGGLVGGGLVGGGLVGGGLVGGGLVGGGLVVRGGGLVTVVRDGGLYVCDG